MFLKMIQLTNMINSYKYFVAMAGLCTCLSACTGGGSSLDSMINFESIDSIRHYGLDQNTLFKGEELQVFLEKYEDALYNNAIGIQEGVEFLDIYKSGNKTPFTGKINSHYISFDLRAFDDISLVKIDTAQTFELVFSVDQ